MTGYQGTGQPDTPEASTAGKARTMRRPRSGAMMAAAIASLISVFQPGCPDGRHISFVARAIAAPPSRPGVDPATSSASTPGNSNGEQDAGARVQMVQAVRAADVTARLGVQPDLHQGNWSTISTMISQAHLIGAGTLRILNPTQGNRVTATGAVDQLVLAGFRLSLIANPGDSPDENVAAVARIEKRFPGSIALVEGPNEPNNWGVDHAGLSGIPGAQAWQKDFYAAMKANKATAHLPVAGLSSYPFVAADSDLNNLHVYPNNGDQATEEIQATIGRQEAVDPHKPFVITEMGWYTLPGQRAPGTQWMGVDERTQAKLLLNAYLSAVQLGAGQILFFSLRDWPATEPDGRFGMFQNDDKPKLAARVFSNLRAVMRDMGSAAASFAPASLAYSVAGAPGMRSLLMQKSNKGFILALWREPRVWDPEAVKSLETPGAETSLRLAAPADITVYEPLAGPEPSQTLPQVDKIRVSVADSPVLLLIRSR